MANFNQYQSFLNQCYQVQPMALKGVFNQYVPLLLQVEGGYTNNPNDNGNWTGGKRNVGNLVGTNFGISAPVYGEWIGRTPTVADMKAITKPIALQIYKKNYWDAMRADSINSQSVANILVDHGINAGVSRAGRMMQEVLNKKFGKNLKVDGNIGPISIQAINSVNSQALFNEYKTAREAYYISLNDPTFGAGWLNRLSKFVYEKKK
jgi:lysozyme family protein